MARIDDALQAARDRVPWSKREINPEEARALYELAAGYNRAGAHILELGTAWGYSCAVMAEAAPLAEITTLNPKNGEWQRAADHLAGCVNVTVLPAVSWNYLDSYDGPELAMIFVDGDHGRVVLDFPWFNWLEVGGLFLMHDYNPVGVKRGCQPVYESANAWRAAMGRDFDVLFTSTTGTSMAGYVRRAGETLPALNVGKLLWGASEEGWVRL